MVQQAKLAGYEEARVQQARLAGYEEARVPSQDYITRVPVWGDYKTWQVLSRSIVS